MLILNRHFPLPHLRPMLTPIKPQIPNHKIPLDTHRNLGIRIDQLNIKIRIREIYLNPLQQFALYIILQIFQIFLLQGLKVFLVEVDVDGIDFGAHHLMLEALAGFAVEELGRGEAAELVGELGCGFGGGEERGQCWSDHADYNISTYLIQQMTQKTPSAIAPPESHQDINWHEIAPDDHDHEQPKSQGDNESRIAQHSYEEEYYRPLLYLKNMLRVLCLLIVFTVCGYVGYQMFVGISGIGETAMGDQSSLIRGNGTNVNTSNITVLESKKDQPTKPQVNESTPTPTDPNTNNPLPTTIKISKFPPFLINGQDISLYGIDKDIQIGSPYDYLNITHSPEFQNFKRVWDQDIEKEATIYSFQFEEKFEQGWDRVLEYRHFKGEGEREDQLARLNNWKGRQNYGSDLPLYLGSHLLWNSSNPKLPQLQLHHLQKKYNLSHHKTQLPLCLFSTGYKISSRGRHIPFLSSLQQQNYTNFHIVAVDDHSPDNTAEEMYRYLENSTMKIRNRIRIVRNGRNLGALASTYFWVRKFCGAGEVVVHVDMDDGLIGRQVFQVINAVYSDPNTWYAYSRYIIQPTPADMPNAGKSRPITFPISIYRHLLDWKTSALRTVRSQIFQSIPLQHLLQYHYNASTNQLQPKFYDTDADRFLIYSQLELCGNSRIRYLDDVLYYYNTSGNIGGVCNMRHQHFDQYKARVKIGVKPIARLGDLGVFYGVGERGYGVPKNVTDGLKLRYNKLLECQAQAQAQAQAEGNGKAKGTK